MIRLLRKVWEILFAKGQTVASHAQRYHTRHGVLHKLKSAYVRKGRP